MKNPFTCELTAEQHCLNSCGKCLGCSGDAEPIVHMEPIDGPDGTPVDVSYTLVGYERYCDVCSSILHQIIYEPEPRITDDDLPF